LNSLRSCFFYFLFLAEEAYLGLRSKGQGSTLRSDERIPLSLHAPLTFSARQEVPKVAQKIQKPKTI
jgi:hypothetical protein